MLKPHSLDKQVLATASGNAARQPIAIIGMGCRFPGGASDPTRFWSNLRQGVDAITAVPADRWNVAQFYDPGLSKPGKTHARWGGFVDHLDQFDPQFFGISPREAERMDPQQRMLLEVTWEAIEEAGVPWEQLAGSRTAVFVGISSWDFAFLGLSFQDRGTINAYSSTGGALSIAANRISYCLDLRGPSASIDTACSSALVALHVACQSIWNDGCPLALAGGVNTLLAPDFFIAFSQLSMLSPDGRCKAFDARANGFVRGEGAGMVLLKPLAQALADNDRIYAVIRGTAANQDGRTPGMTVPRQEAQEALLRVACQNAGVMPNSIQYVEAHGTGTPVGDPIEARALANVLSQGRPRDQRCLIGSVKTNIGHLEAGAGIASLIKVALALHHREIPPNLHFEQPNPEIDFDALQLRVPVRAEPWPFAEGPRLACINSFGYGGTNAHAILQGFDGDTVVGLPSVQRPARATPARPSRAAEFSANAHPLAAKSNGAPAWQLLPLSARCPAALKAVAGQWRQYVDQCPTDISLRELAGHAAHRRSHHEHRLVVVAQSKPHLSEQLGLFAQGEPVPDAVANRSHLGKNPALAFVCSGQGPQWWGMGRELLETEPVFRAMIERCDAMSRRLGSWSLMKELLADESASRMHATAIAQPSIFAIQVALAALWRSWGVTPDQLVGHSVGEVAAAHLAGVFPLEEAFRIVYHRGRCMDLTSSHGRMLAVGLSYAEALELIAPYTDEVNVSAVNSPTSITLSGAGTRLRQLAQLLNERQVFCRELKIEYAFHSPHMDPARDELLKSLKGIQPAKATVPLVSTVTGDRVDGPELDEHYWWRNVRQTVLFADAIERIAGTSADVAVELSPHPVLAYSVTECYQRAGKPVHVICSLKREAPQRGTILRSLGELHTIGYPIKWDEVAPKPGGHLRLPSYPWQRQTCWSESTESRQTRFAEPVHPLLGSSRQGPQPGWQNRLDLHWFPYLADHHVHGLTIFPAAGFAELVLAAACAVEGQAACRVRNFSLAAPCVLTADEAQWLEVAYVPEDRCLKVHTRRADQDGDWTLHVTADRATYLVDPVATRFSWDETRQRCPQHFDRQSCYEFITRLGFAYGPAFQGLAEGWRRPGEAIGIVELPRLQDGEHQEYYVHPALLDACFHTVIVADADYDVRVTGLYLPVKIDQLVLHRRAGSRVICHARLRQKTERRMIADLDIYDQEGQLILEVRGLTSQRVAGTRGDGTVADLLYHYAWQPKPLPPVEPVGEDDEKPPRTPPGSWLVFGDRTGLADALAFRLRAEGHRVTVVRPGDCFQRDAVDRYQINPSVRDDMLQLVRSAIAEAGSRCLGIVHLWNLDAPPARQLETETLETAQEPGVLSVLHLVQAWDAVVGDESTRLLLVTRGAQAAGNAPESVAVAQSPVIGFGRVIVSEYPKFRCKLIDLDPTADAAALEQLVSELRADDEEDEVAWRGPQRLVHRFVRLGEQKQEVPAEVPGLPYRLELRRVGTLDGLALQTAPRRAPEAGEVEIAVRASGLNFSDVMKVLGLYPGLPEGPISLGAECSGVVARVGEGVTEFAPGDEVVTVAPFAFGSHVVAPSALVACKPAHLTFEDAATIPIAFLTAAYALEQLARLRPGERALIHSASGGVGLAAIQLARAIGAEVFATAGTAEKREYLLQQGVSHVMDSRSLEFADQILQRTQGVGVDVILNSLPGEAIPRGMESLAMGGRFLEIGKRDIYQNTRLGLLPFRHNIAFFAIDLDQLLRERPARIGSLLREVLSRFAAGQLTPLPRRTFAVGEIQDAFRCLQQGKHIGKIVVSMESRPPSLEWGACDRIAFDSNATYLITGGLGGFGLALAQWLVDHGARYLALIGRRGAQAAKARQRIEALESAGATVRVLQADVTKPSDVAGVVAEIGRALPPLRGVFHAAMVLEDGLLLNLDRPWMRRVMAPKVNGAWNLHQATRNCSLDYFVLFSSLSSVFGHAGQGNYAAANAFLDSLTHYRRAHRLPCLTVNWGYLGDVGYLAERQQLGERLERQGVMSFTIEEALEALEYALQRYAVQVSVMRVDWSRWRGLGVTGRVSPRFAHLLPHAGYAGEDTRDGAPSLETLRHATPEERRPLVDHLLREKTARLLGVAPERLDGDAPLLDLGLDSLMAVELRNWIESQLSVALPVAQLMRSPGLTHLTEIVCEQYAPVETQVEGAPAEAGEQTLAASEQPADMLANLEKLSSDEVDRLLSTLLKEEADLAGPQK